MSDPRGTSARTISAGFSSRAAVARSAPPRDRKDMGKPALLKPRCGFEGMSVRTSAKRSRGGFACAQRERGLSAQEPDCVRRAEAAQRSAPETRRRGTRWCATRACCAAVPPPCRRPTFAPRGSGATPPSHLQPPQGRQAARCAGRSCVNTRARHEVHSAARVSRTRPSLAVASTSAPPLRRTLGAGPTPMRSQAAANA